MNNPFEYCEAAKSIAEPSEDAFAAYRLSLPEAPPPREKQQPGNPQPIPREKALDVQAKELAEVIKKNRWKLGQNI